MDDFVSRVTSREWRKFITEIFLGKAPRFVSATSGPVDVWIPNIDPIGRATFEGDPWLAVKDYVARDEDVPVRLGRILLEQHRPRRGRYAHPEEEARQRADDLACFFAMEYLVERTKMRPTPAGELVGKRMGLSRQAVTDAWKRETYRRSKK